MLRVFIGYDPRQAISYNVLQHSIVTRSSKPVQVTPLIIEQLPITRTGLTPFTYSRYLVPWLCGYQGWALFMDADMLVLRDVSEAFELADDRYSVMVVKNELGFEWSSVMLINCAKCKVLTPEYVQTAEGLGSFDWLDKEQVGALPAEWNHLVGYDPRKSGQALIHYTQGIPAFPETKGCEYEDEWLDDHRLMNSLKPWAEILAKSVHSRWYVRGFIPKLAATPWLARLRERIWYNTTPTKSALYAFPPKTTKHAANGNAPKIFGKDPLIQTDDHA